MDIENLIRAQRAFFLSQCTKEPDFRLAQLRKLDGLLRKHENDFYRAVEADFGKSAFDTYTTEIGFIYQEIRFYLKKFQSGSGQKGFAPD